MPHAYKSNDYVQKKGRWHVVRLLGMGDAFEFAKDPLAFLLSQKRRGDIVKVNFKHPEAERKLLAELNEVLGDRLPVYQDIRQLRYATQIIQESMRLYPAAWAIPRQAVKRVEIGNQWLEPGDIVLISQYVMHRDPRYFEHPEEFIPERFSADFLKKIPAYAYFPFGGGPRVCIGNHFAMMEAVLILDTIAQNCELRLIPGHPQVVPEPLITMRPRNGLKMQVNRKDS